jgi:hypothetical protein
MIVRDELESLMLRISRLEKKISHLEGRLMPECRMEDWDRFTKEAGAEIVRAFGAHLTTYKAEPNRASQVLQTEDRKAIQEVSLTSPEEIAYAILEGDMELLWKYVEQSGSAIVDPIKVNYNNVIYRMSRELLLKSVSILTRNDVEKIFRRIIDEKELPTGHKFSYMLRHCGINFKQLNVDGRRPYAIKVFVRVTSELRKMLVRNLAQYSNDYYA